MAGHSPFEKLPSVFTLLGRSTKGLKDSDHIFFLSLLSTCSLLEFPLHSLSNRKSSGSWRGLETFFWSCCGACHHFIPLGHFSTWLAQLTCRERERGHETKGRAVLETLWVLEDRGYPRLRRVRLWLPYRFFLKLLCFRRVWFFFVCGIAANVMALSDFTW